MPDSALLADVLVTALAALYALATAVLVVQGLRLGGLALGRRFARARPPRRATPETWPRSAWPRVCVQVPVYNEPAVVARAVDAACAMRYPDLEVQLLDDSTDRTRTLGARAVARAQARGVRATHLTRESRDGYKAGALAAGLAHTTAPLVAVLDADFVPDPGWLERAVPALLGDPALAFVQCRWGHRNADHSWLTRAQAAILDLHFGVEQAGRHRLRRVLPFNGTAGIWRREAIEAAGGWSGATLAEDLDLALRAHVAGWRGAFLESETVDADLPETPAAWHRQQARWAKGMTEVLRLRGRALLGSALSVREKAWALLDVSAPMAYPALLVAILLHPVLAVLAATERGPGATYFALLGLGWLGLGGVLLAHAVAQRDRTAPLARRLADVGLGLAAPVSLALVGTRAVAEAVVGRRTAFARTPKGIREGDGEHAWGERALAVYSLGLGVVLAAMGAWAPFAFQGVFALSLAVVAWPRRPQQAGRLAPSAG